MLARAVAVRRQRRFPVGEEQDRLVGAGRRRGGCAVRLGLQRELRRRNGVAEVRAAKVAVEVLAQRGERLDECPRATPDRRQQVRLIRERDEPHAIARAGLESREQRVRRGEFGGEHAVVEVGVAQPFGQARREVGLREQAREQGRVGAAARAVAVHVPTRRQRRAGGDVDHDHEFVNASAARRRSSADFDERQLRGRFERGRGVDAQPAGVVGACVAVATATSDPTIAARAIRRTGRVLPRPPHSAMLPRDA